jgi:hypothetical protein
MEYKKTKPILKREYSSSLRVSKKNIELNKKPQNSLQNINTILKFSNKIKSNTTFTNKNIKPKLYSPYPSNKDVSQFDTGQLLSEIAKNCFKYLPHIESIKLNLLNENIESFCYSLFRKYSSNDHQLYYQGMKCIFEKLNIFVSKKVTFDIMNYLKHDLPPRTLPNHFNIYSRFNRK